MADTVLQGWALVIGALGIAVPAIITAIISFRNTAKIDRVHDLVNGQSHQLNAMYEARGVVKGKKAERANPSEPKQG